MEQPKCAICGAKGALVPVKTIRPELVLAIDRIAPATWRAGKGLCARHIEEARQDHVTRLLRGSREELSQLEKQVAEAIGRDRSLVAELGASTDEQTLGARVADRVASFGGSWTFIISFSIVLTVWMATNVALASRAFDPFPFILLNLLLSCVAAFQAPVILMSQRRQEEKDRTRAVNDYLVNLKAETEIRLLHEKLDHLLAQLHDHRDEVATTGEGR